MLIIIHESVHRRSRGRNLRPTTRSQFSNKCTHAIPSHMIARSNSTVLQPAVDDYFRRKCYFADVMDTLHGGLNACPVLDSPLTLQPSRASIGVSLQTNTLIWARIKMGPRVNSFERSAQYGMRSLTKGNIGQTLFADKFSKALAHHAENSTST